MSATMDEAAARISSRAFQAKAPKQQNQNHQQRQYKTPITRDTKQFTSPHKDTYKNSGSKVNDENGHKMDSPRKSPRLAAKERSTLSPTKGTKGIAKSPRKVVAQEQTLEQQQKNDTSKVQMNESQSFLQSTDATALGDGKVDEILFGSMNSQWTDALAESIKSAIATGMQSLPLMSSSASNDDTNEQETAVAIQTIQKIYLRHVDVMEAYGKRNIFTLRNLPKSQKRAIVEAFVDQANNVSSFNADARSATIESESQTSKESNATTVDKVGTNFQYPPKEDIPSEEDMQKLKQQVADLRHNLQIATKTRQHLVHQKEGIATAQRSSDQAVMDSLQWLPSSSNDPSSKSSKLTSGPVQKAIGSGLKVRQAIQEGQRVLEQLKDRKQETDQENENDLSFGTHDDESPFSSRWQKRKRGPPLSWEEEYRQEREKVLGSGMTLDSLAAVKDLLKRPPKDQATTTTTSPRRKSPKSSSK